MTVPSVGVSETVRGFLKNLPHAPTITTRELFEYLDALESRLVSLERDSARLDWILDGAAGRIPWQILHGFGGDIVERRIGIDFAISGAISGTQEGVSNGSA